MGRLKSAPLLHRSRRHLMSRLKFAPLKTPMKLFRKVLFWCHLTVGVIAGLVILIMSATGVLLAYERQITYWADMRNYHIAPPSPEATRLSVETLLAKAREAQPGAAITTVTLRAGATEPATIGLAGNPGAGPGSGRTV